VLIVLAVPLVAVFIAAPVNASPAKLIPAVT